MALDVGGALINQAVHTVDLLVWLLGDVLRVHSRTATALHAIETEDTVLSILEFSSSALGVLQATTAAYPGYPRRLETSGSEGTVILDKTGLWPPTCEILPLILKPSQPTKTRALHPAVVSDFRGHQALFEDFIRAIERNTTPVCDGREGRKSIALVEAIYPRRSGMQTAGSMCRESSLA